jgi:hypothetical protein
VTSPLLGSREYDFAAKSSLKFLGHLQALKAPTPESSLAAGLRPAPALLVLAVAMPGVNGVKLGSKAVIGHRDLNNEWKVTLVDLRGDVSLS